MYVGGVILFVCFFCMVIFVCKIYKLACFFACRFCRLACLCIQLLNLYVYIFFIKMCSVMFCAFMIA